MAHEFCQPFAYPIRSDPAAATIGIMRTAEADGDVLFKVKYWLASAGEGEAVTTDPVQSNVLSVPERMIATLPDLVPNAKYEFKIIHNLNDAGDVELERVGTFWGPTDSVDAEVCGALIGDIHNGNDAVADKSAQQLQDVDSVADVMVARGCQIAIFGGDDVHNVQKTYLTGENDSEKVAAVHTAYKNFCEVWERPMSLAACYWIHGNHEGTGAEWYGDEALTESLVAGMWQQWHTAAHKQFFGNPATDIGEDDSEWADPDDITNTEAWVAAPNQPPFESSFAIRHGPVLIVGVDTERFGAPGESALAGIATLGESQLNWAVSAAQSSDAIWKILILHRPSGGYRRGDATLTSYRRGNPAVVAGQKQYAWGRSEFERLVVGGGFHAVMSYHDHINTMQRYVKRSGIPCFQGGSPTVPFSWTTHFRGLPSARQHVYNNFRSIWVYNATRDVCVLRCIRTVNGDRDGTLNEVVFEHRLKRSVHFG